MPCLFAVFEICHRSHSPLCSLFQIPKPTKIQVKIGQLILSPLLSDGKCWSKLISRAVFPFLLVFQDGEVRGIARWGQLVVFQCFEHGTSWFVRMRAVAEAAVGRELENVAEEMRHFLAFHVERAETFDARDVDDRAAAFSWKVKEFAEGGGVHARSVCFRDLCRSGVRLRHKTIEER